MALKGAFYELDLPMIIIIILLLLLICGVFLSFSLGVKQGQCQCPEIDPVAAFIQSQPDIAINMVGVPADKINRALYKKGWDNVFD